MASARFLSFAEQVVFRHITASSARTALLCLLLVCGTCCTASAQRQPLVQSGTAPVQQTADQIAMQQHVQQVQNLISRAEESYKSGVDNYNANRLDAARMDFDFAVDTMLSSGMDLKGDPILSDEFERLLSAINSLEMVALQQGNGFTPKIESSPLETEQQDITFPANPELVAKLSSELNVTSDLPLVINDQVAGYINVFAQSNSFRAHMAASLQRVGKYRGLIQRVLQEEGVPQDLIYLAVAESGFQPRVVNTRSGAGGMWQFMTFTGVEYGLTRNGYFDYRFDPEKSSRAYAQYIKKLHSRFGDWYLAMAAYDWGPGGIERAVQRTGFADFWELYRRNAMPAETRAYVPKILAAVIMAKNPEKYGLDKLVPSPPVIYDTINTSYAISVPLIADLTDSTPQEIAALNPALLRLSTPQDVGFDLHIPPGTHDVFLDRLKMIPEEDRGSWRFHVAKASESLETIAALLHGRAAEIADVNHVTAADPLKPGDELVVPVESMRQAMATQHYKTHRGDSLVTIADRFNVSVEQLRSWNRLSTNSVVPGRTIYVSEPVRVAVGGRGSRGRRGRAASASSRGGSVRGARASRGVSTRGASSSASHGASSQAHEHVRAHAAKQRSYR